MPTLDFPYASHVLINKEKNSNDSMMIPRVEEEMELHREGQPSELLEISQSLNNFRFNYHTHTPRSNVTAKGLNCWCSSLNGRVQGEPSRPWPTIWFPELGLLLWYQFLWRFWMFLNNPPLWKPIIVIERCTFRRELFHPWSYRKVHLQMQMMVEVFSSNTRPG